MPTSSSRDIYARWGYSEISSPYSADQYARAPKIEHLREARAAGAPFAEIVEADRAHLAYICGLVRTPLTRFTIGIENFEEIALARATLADLKVPRSISRLPRMSFAAFMVTNSPDPADCRNMVANGEYV